MIKIFGSNMCPDCIAAKFNFDFYHIEYEFVDINESLKNLKEFLAYRDTSSLFSNVKETHSIGIPACIDENGNLFIDWKEYMKKRGMNPLNVSSKSCSKDGKGC